MCGLSNIISMQTALHTYRELLVAFTSEFVNVMNAFVLEAHALLYPASGLPLSPHAHNPAQNPAGPLLMLR